MALCFMSYELMSSSKERYDLPIPRSMAMPAIPRLAPRYLEVSYKIQDLRSQDLTVPDMELYLNQGFRTQGIQPKRSTLEHTQPTYGISCNSSKIKNIPIGYGRNAKTGCVYNAFARSYNTSTS